MTADFSLTGSKWRSQPQMLIYCSLWQGFSSFPTVISILTSHLNRVWCSKEIQQCKWLAYFKIQGDIPHVFARRYLWRPFERSYNKRQKTTLFFKFVLIKNCTCFGQIYCPSSGVSTLYKQQQVFDVCWAVHHCDNWRIKTN